jgi:hypothetical protein
LVHAVSLFIIRLKPDESDVDWDIGRIGNVFTADVSKRKFDEIMKNDTESVTASTIATGAE